MNQLILWTGYSKSLKGANAFLIVSDTIFGRNISLYVITDGTSYVSIDAGYPIFSKYYVGGTYTMIVELISSDQAEEIGAGDYVNYQNDWFVETPLGSGQYSFTTPTKIGFLSYIEGADLEDLVNLRTAETFFTGLNIKLGGAMTDKKDMTVEFSGTMMIYPIINLDNFYPGSISVSAKVQDITSYIQPAAAMIARDIAKQKIKVPKGKG